MSSPIIVAVDFSDTQSAWNFIDRVDPKDCRLKIGKELFTHAGPEFIKKTKQKPKTKYISTTFNY